MNTQSSVDTRIKVGIIGFGRMGRFYWEAMTKSDRWNIAYICDTDPESRQLAKELAPGSLIVEDNQKIFEDESVQVVGLFTLADSRMGQIEKAIRYGKHIISEKPIADTMENEWKVVEMTENTNLISTVNLYLRNSWYHNLMKEYIQQGEIGELAIIRICHMTPGLAPGEGHEYEGPAFHDCGMHYVDITRWYAGCDYRTWNAQGVNMWNYKDPWWVQCHDCFFESIRTTIDDTCFGITALILASILHSIHINYSNIIKSFNFLLNFQFVSIRTYNKAETIQLICDCSHFLCYQRFNNNSHYLSLLFKLRYCQ